MMRQVFKWMTKSSPVNVVSQRPAFQSFMVLSADPESIRPCSGKIITAQTAAEWPWSTIDKQTSAITFLAYNTLVTTAYTHTQKMDSNYTNCFV